MLYLRKLSRNDDRSIYDMLQGIESNENGFHNDVKDMPYEQFAEWLRKSEGFSHGIGMEDWMVPGTTYWLFDDDIPVGIGRLRHCLNDSLRKDGGHIGYAVSYPYRGRGYGTAILRLLLIEARKMGIEKALVIPHRDNEPSNRLIRANGGRLVGETEDKNYYIIEGVPT